MKKVSRRSALKLAAGASIIAAIGSGEDAPLERSELTPDVMPVAKTVYLVNWSIEVVFDDEAEHIRDKQE